MTVVVCVHLLSVFFIIIRVVVVVVDLAMIVVGGFGGYFWLYICLYKVEHVLSLLYQVATCGTQTKKCQNCSSSNGHLRQALKASQSPQTSMCKCQLYSRNKHVYSLVQKKKKVLVSIANFSIHDNSTGSEFLYDSLARLSSKYGHIWLHKIKMVTAKMPNSRLPTRRPQTSG